MESIDSDDEKGDDLLIAQLEQRILAAVNDSAYVWRTVEGLARDTGLSGDEVDEIINRSDKFIKARRSNQHGQSLYSTREKYEADAGIRERLLSVITNRLGG
ncbi:hypothetical protein AB4Y40_40320 [Paraburkholderia sp. EG287B]|uniref:hypothetical protein n=1 Tax=Paraburkholderia sp. EG287B TaxID=3237010 RepID=UPI0034D2F8D2